MYLQKGFILIAFITLGSKSILIYILKGKESKEKMNTKKYYQILLVLLFFFTASSLVIAEQERSFRITNYQAQVQILTNGDIKVSEIFTYHFTGNFSGITRSIGLKGYDYIVDFNAFEYTPLREPLEVVELMEEEMITYRIYDQSSNEEKSFLLEFLLKSVITKYNDIAELYWKFFDHTNTSPIDHITIEIHFPNQNISAENIQVFGHGPAHGWASIEDEEFVLFQISDFPSDELLAARILFPTEFVPNASRKVFKNAFNQIMKEELRLKKRK